MTICPLLAVRACVRLCARVFIYVRLCMLKKSSQHSQHRLLATAAAGGLGMAYIVAFWNRLGFRRSNSMPLPPVHHSVIRLEKVRRGVFTIFKLGMSCARVCSFACTCVHLYAFVSTTTRQKLLTTAKKNPQEKYCYSCTDLNLTVETDERICKGTHKTGTARTPSLPHAHTSCHTHTNARHAPMTACPLLAVRACVRLCARVFIYVRLCMLKKSSQHSQHRLRATAAGGGRL